MFKRFMVTDLFHGETDIENGEWVNAKTQLPKKNDGIYKVKLENGDETTAYFYEDRIASMMKYFTGTPSCWWHKQDKYPLYNVIQWRDHNGMV